MLDESTRRLVAAEQNQELLNFHENLKSTRKLVASGNSDIDSTGKIWPHNLHISIAYVPHLQKVFSNVRQRYGLSPGDKNGKSRCKCGFMINVYVRYSSSCSSSWKRLSPEFPFHQESVHAIIEAVVSSYWETDHGSDTNSNIPVIDWQQQMWQRTTLLTDKAVHRSRLQKPMSFPIQCCVWEASVQFPSEPGRTRSIGSWNHVNL